MEAERKRGQDGSGNRVVVVGGGAAGYFGALAVAEAVRTSTVTILEATATPLDKVRISGGGRCNVTHNCFDPKLLVAGYPRGHRELIGPFNRFQPRDTVGWFEARGVSIKAEPDGRMFPVTDRSETIIECLTQSAQRAGVQLQFGARVEKIEIADAGQPRARFLIRQLNGDCLPADQVLIATGNSHDGHAMAASLGHTIVPCVPSLFTFKVHEPDLTQLSGLSVQDADLVLTVGDRIFKQRGPVLITHWGLSGPAILKLSAWAARELAETRYQARLQINWFAGKTGESCRDLLKLNHSAQGKKLVSASGIEPIPRRLWSYLVKRAGIPESTFWSNLSRANMESLMRELSGMSVDISGKGQFKEEFVTCGGVNLKEVDFRTMQSRIVPGLYFAGEILDIDGITGGFNFQSAWTTGWLAGTSMASAIVPGS